MPRPHLRLASDGVLLALALHRQFRQGDHAVVACQYVLGVATKEVQEKIDCRQGEHPVQIERERAHAEQGFVQTDEPGCQGKQARGDADVLQQAGDQTQASLEAASLVFQLKRAECQCVTRERCQERQELFVDEQAGSDVDARQTREGCSQYISHRISVTPDAQDRAGKKSPIRNRDQSPAGVVDPAHGFDQACECNQYGEEQRSGHAEPEAFGAHLQSPAGAVFLSKRIDDMPVGLFDLGFDVQVPFDFVAHGFP